MSRSSNYTQSGTGASQSSILISKLSQNKQNFGKIKISVLPFFRITNVKNCVIPEICNSSIEKWVHKSFMDVYIKTMIQESKRYLCLSPNFPNFPRSS